MDNKQQDLQEQDPVWDLLGKASKREADPMFSRNVMRSIRLEDDKPTLWQRLFSPVSALTAVAGVAACAVVAILSMNPAENNEQTANYPKPLTANTEVMFDEIAKSYDVPKDMDEIIAPVSFTQNDDTQLILAEDDDGLNSDM